MSGASQPGGLPLGLHVAAADREDAAALAAAAWYERVLAFDYS